MGSDPQVRTVVRRIHDVHGDRDHRRGPPRARNARAARCRSTSSARPVEARSLRCRSTPTSRTRTSPPYRKLRHEEFRILITPTADRDGRVDADRHQGDAVEVARASSSRLPRRPAADRPASSDRPRRSRSTADVARSVAHGRSARAVHRDHRSGGSTDRPFNRISNELSEVADGLAVVESFSHSVVLDTGDGLVAFDASHALTGRKVVAGDHRAGRTRSVSHIVYTHGHADHVGGSRGLRRRVRRHDASSATATSSGASSATPYTNDWNVLINARQFGGVNGDFGMGDVPRLHPVRHGPTEPRRRRPRHARGRRPDDRTAPRTRRDRRSPVGAGCPRRSGSFVGDFIIWNFPNAGNPQKVQRFPIEWAAALRTMIAKEPELLLPAHGLPIEGKRAHRHACSTTSPARSSWLVREVVDMMNAGEVLDTIVHSVTVPDDLLAEALPPAAVRRARVRRPQRLAPVRWLVGRCRRAASSRHPTRRWPTELADLAGGAGVLIDRAQCSSPTWVTSGWPATSPIWPAGRHRPMPASTAQRAVIYRARRKPETSLMAKGIFAGAARESEAIADRDPEVGRDALRRVRRFRTAASIDSTLCTQSSPQAASRKRWPKASRCSSNCSTPTRAATCR